MTLYVSFIIDISVHYDCGADELNKAAKCLCFSRVPIHGHGN